MEKIGEVSYKVQLLESAKVHPVFHISQHKKAIGNQPYGGICFAITIGIRGGRYGRTWAMLAAIEIAKGGTIIKQWLVRWKGRTKEETTWENEVLQSQFPSFSLEDKVVVA